MKNYKNILLALCFLSASFSVTADDKHNLIDPQLSQFQNVYNYGEAKVVDGNIEMMSTNNFFLLTKKSYKNFILEAEVLLPNVDEYVNSGVIFRAQLKAKNGAHEAVGYQAEADPSDRKWHDMMPPIDASLIPPAPVLSVEQALQSMQVKPNFVQPVAAEPVVTTPVALSFDGNGRMWVAEMKTFMPDLDGNNEMIPESTIAILEDINGDGQVDSRKVFLDDVVLPRTISSGRF